MSTTRSTSRSGSRSAAVLLGAARAVMLLLGLTGIAGATYFTFFASPEQGGVVTAFDWFVAVWKIVVCVGYLVVALAPGWPAGRRVTVALWLVGADVVFGLVKLFGYGEEESLGFFVPNAVLLGLLLAANRRTAPAAPPAEHPAPRAW